MFLFFNENHDINNVIISTSCPGLFIAGLHFPSFVFEHRITITEEKIAIQSNLPDDTHTIKEFLRIRQPSEGYAITLNFYFNGSITGEIKAAELFIFGSVFTTSLTIASGHLKFGAFQMNKMYRKTLESKAYGEISANDNILSLTISSEVNDEVFKNELEKYVRNYTENELAALKNRLDFIMTSKQAMQEVFYSYDDLFNEENAALSRYTSLLANAEVNLMKLDKLVEKYESDVDTLISNNSSLLVDLLSVCDSEICTTECAVKTLCKMCETSVTMNEWGGENKDELENITVNYKKVIKEYEWSSGYQCRLTTSIKSWGVTKYGQICSYKSVHDLKTKQQWVSETNESVVSNFRPVVINSFSVPSDELCFTRNTCGLHLPSSQCLFSNGLCQITQLDALNNTDHEQSKEVETFTKMLQAKSDQTLAFMKVQQLRYQKSVVECKNEMYKYLLQFLYNQLLLEDENYDRVLEDLGYVEEIGVILFNNSVEEIFQLKSVLFDVSFSEHSPSFFPITIVYEVPFFGESYESLITVDFTSPDSIIKRDIASSIIRQIGKKLVGAQITEQYYYEDTTSFHEQRFDQHCAMIGSIKHYIAELNSTFQALQSKNQELKLQIYNQSNYSLAGINVSDLVIDIDILEDYLNYSTTEQMMLNSYLSSEEYNSLVDTLEQVELDSHNISDFIDDTFPIAWWVVVSKIHNSSYLTTVGNRKCYGFSDCLNVCFQILNEIVEDPFMVNDVLVDYTSELLNAKENISKLSQKIMLVENIWNLLEPLYNIASKLESTSIWCNEKPTIKQFEPVLYAEIGSSVMVECEGDKTDYFQWFKYGFLLHENNTRELVINEVKESDEGQYCCSALNVVGTTFSNIFTLVVYIPPVLTLSPSNMTTFEGNEDDALFVCNATGYPTPSYSWYFSPDKINWKTVDSSSNEHVVHKPTKNEEGWYRCGVSIDMHENLSEAAFLMVIGASISKISYPIEFHMAIYTVNESHLLTDGYTQGLHETLTDAIKHEETWHNCFIENMRIDIDHQASVLHVSFHISTHYEYSLTKSIADQALEANTNHMELMRILDNTNFRLREASISFDYVGDFFYTFPYSFAIGEIIYACDDGQKLLENEFICGEYANYTCTLKCTFDIFLQNFSIIIISIMMVAFIFYCIVIYKRMEKLNFSV